MPVFGVATLGRIDLSVRAFHIPARAQRQPFPFAAGEKISAKLCIRIFTDVKLAPTPPPALIVQREAKFLALKRLWTSPVNNI
jgi:hypothetical protein